MSIRHYTKNAIALSTYALGCSALSGTALAVDDNKLWLPKKYQELFLNLKDAALAAKGIERCVEVVRGTIDLGQSKPGEPIYRILCRQENGRTINEMVDGNSLVVLTYSPPDYEAQKLAHWEQCDFAFKDKTKLMNNVVWLNESMPTPTIFTPEETHFSVKFNAEDPFGLLLKYAGECSVVVDQSPVVKIRPRREE